MASPSTVQSADLNKVRTRYVDAYRVAKVIIKLGNILKGLGLLLAVIIIGVAFQAAQESNSVQMFILVTIGAVLLGLLCFIGGTLLAANGQLLAAALDTAVYSSSFLDNSDRAEIMSVR